MPAREPTGRREVWQSDRVDMLRLVAREARRQVLVGRGRAALPEEAGEVGAVERVVDGPAQRRVVAEERPLRVQREVRDDRLLHDEQVPAVATELRRECLERRGRDLAVVGRPPLELEADLRAERAEVVEDRRHVWTAWAAIVRVALQKQRAAAAIVRD